MPEPSTATCRKCGAGIARNALICYRCGAATTEAKFKPAAIGPRRPTAAIVAAVALGALALAGAFYFLLHSTAR